MAVFNVVSVCVVNLFKLSHGLRFCSVWISFRRKSFLIFYCRSIKGTCVCVVLRVYTINCGVWMHLSVKVCRVTCLCVGVLRSALRWHFDGDTKTPLSYTQKCTLTHNSALRPHFDPQGISHTHTGFHVFWELIFYQSLWRLPFLKGLEVWKKSVKSTFTQRS